MSIFTAYHTCKSGAAAIEAVFALPMLFVIGFGAIDGSMLMMHHHKAESGLVSAGNYLAQTPTPTAFEARAKRLATTGQITSGGDRKIGNWSVNDVSISYKSIANNDTGSGRNYRGGDTVRVVRLSTSIPFKGIGLIRSVTGGTTTITASYEERLVAEQS